MSTPEPEMGMGPREWKIAIGVVVGGFVIAIAVAAYLTFGRTPPPTPEQLAAQQAKHQVVENTKACIAAMKSAQGFGIVPPFAKLINPNPQETDVVGRYGCIAATPSAQYVLKVDLICHDYTNAKCTSLASVAQDDGSVLYQRQ
ncbi:MAG TPA: hypothetical protein VK779_12830 [Rhizomicrobium sp.]|nr:hypothetical protein [Rhizomicrobium sp.]